MKAYGPALSGGNVPLAADAASEAVQEFGEPLKMSKRAGNWTLRDLVEQVGADVTRFVMLTRKNDAPLDFDFDKVLEQSRENPVYYAICSRTRVHVMRRAADLGIDVQMLHLP